MLYFIWLKLVVKTSCVGLLPRKGCCMSNLFKMSLLYMTMTLSLGRVSSKGSLESNVSLVGHFKEDPHYGYLKETTSWEGDDNKLLDLLFVRERKAKGMRELKNLDCSISPVKSQRRLGGVGSKNAFSFPPEVH